MVPPNSDVDVKKPGAFLKAPGKWLFILHPYGESAQHKADECTCPPTPSRENRIRQQHIAVFMPIAFIAFLSFLARSSV